MSGKVYTIADCMALISAVMAMLTVDHGVKFTNLGRGFIEGSFFMLSDRDQAFLHRLSRTGELPHIIMGETRDGADGDTLWYISGKWQTLPAGVDKWLSNIWDFVIEGDKEYTE